MRMRRKKYLEERLLSCKDYIIYFEERERYGRPDKNDYPTADYKKAFCNDNSVQLEIGCGKGKFILETAMNNPDINFIAVEKDDNVIVSAIEKVKNAGLKNVKFMIVRAENLDMLIPENSVEKIYLNFSCPYPKKTYKNRRLTNPRFLRLYSSLLSRGGSVIQKTDNADFFEYSVNSFKEEDYTLIGVTYDLYSSEFYKGNVATEYEEKFVYENKPIMRLEAFPPEK